MEFLYLLGISIFCGLILIILIFIFKLKRKNDMDEKSFKKMLNEKPDKWMDFVLNPEYAENPLLSEKPIFDIKTSDDNLSDLKNIEIEEVLKENLNRIKILNPIKSKAYFTVEFLKDLRSELEKNVSTDLLWGNRLTKVKLSVLIGQNKEYVKNTISNAKRNPNHRISLNELEIFKQNIILNLPKKYENSLKIIEKYKSLNILSKSKKKRIYLFHPDINLNYFEKIDTKEKAYWLGFIYADGSIYKINNQGESIRFGFDLSRKDDLHLIKFAEEIGLNQDFIKRYDRVNKITGKTHKMVKLEFSSKQFTNNLKKHGVIPKKTFKIELPSLGSRELDLAFLLGFFDGDGKEGTTVIGIGNKKFLIQIKERYNLQHEVIPDKNNKNSHALSLGAKLFNEILENYEDSLPRKRKTFIVNKYKTADLTQAKLKKLLFEMPTYIIAHKFGVSQTTITRLCNRFNLTPPSKSYWNDKEYPHKNESISFQDFSSFYEKHPNRENTFYFQKFPYNPPSSIKFWKKKAQKTINKRK